MLIFIDDSGDPGFKLEKGSTRHFVIVMVIFNDELEAEKTALAIKQLKRELGFSEQTEFRFFKILRQKFFTYIKRELNFKEKRIIKNCKLIDSKSDVLIQLADMIAGSIHRSQNIDKPDHFDYLKVIKNLVEDIWRY